MNEEVINLSGGFNGENNDLIPAENNHKKEQNSRPKKFVFLLGILIVALLGLAVGIIPRLNNQAELRAATQGKEDSTPSVTTLFPHKPAATAQLSLPGTTQAIQETVVSARTNGYVRRYLVDIGDRVREGQILAEIDTPELDQQLLQARQELESARLEVNQAEHNVNRADQDVLQARQNLEQARAELEQAAAGLKQTKTNKDLARVTLTRSKNLVSQGIVPRQETDERQAAFDVSEASVGVAEANIRNRQANIRAAQAAINSKLADVAALKELVEARRAQVKGQEANVARLVRLQSFGSVTAPFAGVITARNVDTGSLITQNGGTTGGNSTNAGNADSGLFRLARVDAIRIFVNVPQTNLAAIFPGLVSEVRLREFPDIKFEGKVVRTANALDSASRTLPVEVLIPNDDFKILPGMYADVNFNLSQPGSVVMIPASALVVRPEGTFTAVVTKDSTLHFKQVETGRELGKEVEILSGLSTEDRIVPTQTDALSEGAFVKVTPAPESTEK